MQYKLVSSNENKIKEFKRFGLDIVIEKGVDLPEVDGTAEEVIIYKALEAGEGRCVEDTSLEIEGLEIGVNIRWLVSQLLIDSTLEGKKAVWTTYVGVNTGEEIKIFKGVVEGTIVSPRIDGFAFDPIFLIPSLNQTLSELDAEGHKDNYSARKIACVNMIEDNPVKTVKICDIPVWTGNYQH